MRLRRLALLGEYSWQLISLGPQWIFMCSRPPPHDCIFTPRFPEVVTILAEERESFEG